MTTRHHRTEVRVGGPRILGQNCACILELLLMRGKCTTHMRCVNACPFWEHAKRALLIVIFKRECACMQQVSASRRWRSSRVATDASLLRRLAKAWMVEG